MDGTSSVQPTTVSTRPSGWGSSNHRPRVKPSLSSTRRDAALRWSGVGTRMLWAYVRDVVVPHYPGLREVFAAPDPTQVGSPSR